MRCLALQPDGRILLSGTWPEPGEFGYALNLLARIERDGSFDTSFQALNVLDQDDFGVYSIAVQSDGRILIAGEQMGLDWPLFTLARLHPNGSLDTSYQPRLDSYVEGIALQPDGRLVIAGDFRRVNEAPCTGVARLNVDGSLDTTFDCRVWEDWAYQSIPAMALQPDGRILIAGYFTKPEPGSPHEFTLARLHADGTLDTSFQANIQSSEVMSYPMVSTIAFQTDGQVLIGGWFTEVGGMPQKYLARIEGGGPIPPMILASSSNQRRLSGQTVVLRAVTEGAAPLQYQWLFDGAPLPGATSATLVLNNVQPAQAGSYTLVASNDLGLATSAPIALTVLPMGTSPGSLDFTFDPTLGGELIGPAREFGEVVALARQTDGKLVIAGQFSGYNGRLRRHIARIHPNGALDEGFNPGLGADGWVYATALQSDGKVLVGGCFSVFDTQPRAALARLNPDGSLDTGFAAGVGCDGYPGAVLVIGLQGDGKILIGGNFSKVNGTNRTGVARLNADGTLDPTFNPPSDTNNYSGNVCSLWLLADGKLLVGGRLLDRRCLLHRLNSDGSVDSSFATKLTGYELTQFAVRSDGKIYAAGCFDLGEPGWYYHRLVLLNEDGTLDPGFAVNFGGLGSSGFAALTAEPDDQVVISGWFQSANGVPRSHIARLNPDGTLDESFDPGSTLGEWYPGSHARSMLLEPDGHLWLSGYAQLSNGAQVALLRLEPNGQLDDTFYTQAGEVDIAGDYSYIEALTALSDGRVYVGGLFDSFNNEPCANLVRLLPDGTWDRTFWPMWTNRLEARLLALQPDGKLLVGGPTVNGSHHYADVVRLNPDGSLDCSFASPSTWDMRLHCMALQADGKILVGGEFWGGLARLNADGSLDDTFQPPYLPAYDGDAVHAVAVQPDGKILLGGSAAIGLGRLYPDGSADPSFECDAPVGHVVEDILIQPDGRILIAGSACIMLGDEMYGMARIHPDGRVDTNFNARIGWEVSALTVAPDGHILAAAQEMWGAQPTRIYRLNRDGIVDGTFQTRLGMMYGGAAVADIIAQADGRVLIGGSFTSVNGIPVDGLARLNGVPMPWVVRDLPSGCVPGMVVPVGLAATPAVNVGVYAVEDQPPTGWIVTNISHGGVFDTRTSKVKLGPFFDAVARTLSYEVLAPTGAQGGFTFAGQGSADGVDTAIGGDDRILLAYPHPADGPPADWILSISEVTAYGAAWRRGTTWPQEPNPIPIDYVTRAAALWKAGECYTLDGQATNAPLWWVSCSSSMSRLDRSASPAFQPVPGLAVRQLPEFALPAEALTVSLVIAPSPQASTCAFEEVIPVGLVVSEITGSGEWDAANRKVKWGPFLDAMSRTVSYRVARSAWTVPLSELGWAGVASFDGASLPIAPAASWPPVGRVQAGLLTPAGALSLVLRGVTGASYQIEVSADLRSWVPFCTLTNSTGRIEFSDPQAASHPARFYRARLLP